MSLIDVRLSKTEGRVRALSIDPSGDKTDIIGQSINDLLNNDDWDGCNNLVRGLVKSKRYELCIELLDGITKKAHVPDKYLIEINRMLGVCYAMNGAHHRAINILSKYTDSISALMALAYCSQQLSDPKKQLEYMDLAKSLDKLGTVDLLISKYYPELANE